MTDSKEKILADWNALKLEQEFPWRRLVFKKFNELERYVRGAAKFRGNPKRKTRLDGTVRANIIDPRPNWTGAVKARKRDEERLTHYVQTFLARIKALRRGLAA